MHLSIMTIIFGEERSGMGNSVVVADTDALIALQLKEDIHHEKAKRISASLLERRVSVIFPVTVFPETITFLRRAVNQTEKAHQVSQQLKAGIFTVEYIDERILQLATDYFDKADSKKNTFFDAIVAATAKKLEAEIIFSFDNWYPKLGFKLASDF